MKHITPIMVRDELWELCCFLWIPHLRGTRANIYLIYSTFYPHSIHLPLTRQHLLSWHEPISFRDLLAFPHPVTCCSHSQCVTGRSDIKAGWWCNDNLRTLSVCSTGARAHTHTHTPEALNCRWTLQKNTASNGNTTILSALTLQWRTQLSSGSGSSPIPVY